MVVNLDDHRRRRFGNALLTIEGARSRPRNLSVKTRGRMIYRALTFARSIRNCRAAIDRGMKPSTRVLTLSTVAFTLLFAVWLMFGVLGVPIKKEMHLDTVQFSWLTAIAVLSGSIWRLPLGIWTDRVG